MKENILEVLIYLFENYLEVEIDLLPHSNPIKNELLLAGFKKSEVDKAFVWLESLNIDNPIKLVTSATFRVFSHEEISRLNLDCRNLIIFLGQYGILTSTNRELVIDRIMALDHEDITLEELKCIVLIVLLSQPNKEIFSQIENIVYKNITIHPH